MYKRQHIHFVGVGGIGMSGLAQVLLQLGYKVSGSDLRSTDITNKLAVSGGIIYKGHEAKHIQGADVVVYSSAVPPDNPEILAAHQANIPIIPRAELLAELMRLKKFGIAVAGAHGKTSTTSMAASVLQASGVDPTVIIGGKVKALGTHAVWGNGDFLLAEADESDGSFLRLTPSIVAVTNIDREHLDFYSNMDNIVAAFYEFIEKIPFYGLAVLCADDSAIASLLPSLRKRYLTYGTCEQADLRAVDIELIGFGVRYRAVFRGKGLGEIRLRVPGLHYLRNSLAAMAIGLELELPFDAISRGLYEYQGVGRRFEVIGERDGITFVDDYAHHPTEIGATLKTARYCWPDRRLVVLFEPHRYTRTLALMDEFPAAFQDADMLFLTEIYPASERPIVGVSGERLARKIEETGCPVSFVPSVSELPECVSRILRQGDVVLTLGAGSIGQVGYTMLSQLLNGQAIA
ncbi:MAG: UDP-N-acetylmuramate--L-alanine ligase [Dissulfuribacterales bacterium]